MKQTTMITPRTWNTETGTIRVLPRRCRLLDMALTLIFVAIGLLMAAAVILALANTLSS